MSFFSPNSPLYKFMNKLLDILKLNFLWLLFSLPLITIGASTVAAHSLALKMAEDEEGYFFKPFWKSFRENFLPATLLWIITLVAGYAIYLDFQFFNALEGNPIIFLIIGIIAILAAVAALLYAYPLLARYDNTLQRTLQLSTQIAARYFGRTLIIVLLLVIEILIVAFNIITIFFGIIFGPGFMIYTLAAMTRRIFTDIDRRNREDDHTYQGF